MATIKYTQDENSTKKIILKDIDGQKKVSCECCSELVRIKFESDSYEYVLYLETRIVDGNNFESANCSALGNYMTEICPDPFNPWESTFFFDAGTSRNDGYWSSSFNFELWADMDAGCYGGFEPWMDDPVDGYCQPPFETYNVLVTIEYKGVIKTKSYETFAMLTESNYANHQIGSFTIYESQQSDGSHFEIM